MINAILKKTKPIWFVPSLIICLLMTIHFVFQYYEGQLTEAFELLPTLKLIEHCCYCIIMAFCQYWLVARAIEHLSYYLADADFFKRYETGLMVLPFCVSVLKIIVFLIIVNVLTQKLVLPEGFSYLLSRISSILIICSISAILFKMIAISEQLILKGSKATLTGLLAARKMVTQTLIFKRVAYGIVSLVALGSILMLFDNVRAIGASVLTTAGILGLVLTFTAQRSLGSIVSGLEIALLQPIKLGDKIQIENKEGTIKEINFRNVVLKLGDGSHFSVPTNFFLEKPFQNWNYVEKTNLIGSAVLYVDYGAPIAEIRNHLQFILQKNPFWDHNIWRLQVSALRENTIELKITASSQDADNLTELLADLRERLITYIVENFPGSLPKTRIFACKELLD